MRAELDAFLEKPEKVFSSEVRGAARAAIVQQAMAREPEQRFHFAAARRLGIPRDKLVEMITHAAHYAGWPNAVGALRSLEDVWPSGE